MEQTRVFHYQCTWIEIEEDLEKLLKKIQTEDFMVGQKNQTENSYDENNCPGDNDIKKM